MVKAGTDVLPAVAVVEGSWLNQLKGLSPSLSRDPAEIYAGKINKSDVPVVGSSPATFCRILN